MATSPLLKLVESIVTKLGIVNKAVIQMKLSLANYNGTLVAGLYHKPQLSRAQTSWSHRQHPGLQGPGRRPGRGQGGTPGGGPAYILKTLLCTPPSRAKRGWVGCILFFATFRFVPDYYRVSCLRFLCILHLSA